MAMNNLRDKECLRLFGLKVNQLRKSKNMTLEQVAFEMDVEISQVHRIEKGKINPTYTTLLALARALSISIADLVQTK